MDIIWALDCSTQETNSPAVSTCSAVWPLSVSSRALLWGAAGGGVSETASKQHGFSMHNLGDCPNCV